MADNKIMIYQDDNEVTRTSVRFANEVKVTSSRPTKNTKIHNTIF